MELPRERDRWDGGADQDKEVVLRNDRTDRDRDKRKRERSRSRSRGRNRDRDVRARDNDRFRGRREADRGIDRGERRRSRDRDGEKDRRVQSKSERAVETSDRTAGAASSRRREDYEKESKPIEKALSEEAQALLREEQRAAEQVQLDDEMQKRRERVRAWQEAKRLAEMGDAASSTSLAISEQQGTDKAAGELLSSGEAAALVANASTVVDDSFNNSQSLESGWTLDDENDDSASEEALLQAGLGTEPVEEMKLPTAFKPVEAPIESMKELARAAHLPSSSSVSASAITAAATEYEAADPLDAFMSSLYSSGDVAAQSVDAATAVQPASLLSIPAYGPVTIDASIGAPLITAPSLSTSIEEEAVDDSEYFDGVNQFGSSNYITLEQIMGGGSETANTKPQFSWESDTETIDEEREERERAEFVEALRRFLSMLLLQMKIDKLINNMKCRAQEADEDAAEKEFKRAMAEEKSKQDLGVIYAEEGDVIDETEIERKRKTALDVLEEARRGKEVRTVDHAAVQYLPFRKNLFIVPRALARLNDEQLKERRDALQIKVRGKGCPPPIESWEQCGLSDRVLAVLEKNDLLTPFAIQRQAIPAIMCGRDVIGVAKTGSGKTLAFLLPMIRHILDQPPLKENEGPIGLIMAPARELAFQIYNEAKKFSKALNLRVGCIYGGAGVAEQIGELKRGAEIVVCTPGRMIDILCMQAGKLVSLRRVTMVVMDEADRMFDMGFEPQIKMILQTIRPDRQTVLFSATFPKQIERLARSILKLPLEIVIGERSVVNKDIVQCVEVHEEEDKFMRLLQLLGVWYERGSVLIFVDKQEKCDGLFTDLLKAGYPCLSLHGGKDQLDRDYALHEFKTLIKTVMVATSVAGRGLDVPEIVCVINYNCPNHLEDYVHRVGRTGRAGRKGTAYTFVTPSEDQYAHIMIKALQHANAEIPTELAQLGENFKSKVARGEAKWVSSGFVGKGFTFSADEMNDEQKKASLQKRAYEIEQGIREELSDNEDEIFDMDDEPLAIATTSAPAPPLGQTSTGTEALSAAGLTGIDKAKALVSSMAMTRPIETSAPLGVLGVVTLPVGPIDTQAALARARLLAAQATSVKSTANNEIVSSTESHFADEVEINDYPIQARRKVTHRQSLDDIAERTGVNVISRGVYVEPGKLIKLGERKLYLLLEGTTEMQVRQAKLDIQRILDEETLKLGTSISMGRYAVV